jgi:hypothetical protein
MAAQAFRNMVRSVKFCNPGFPFWHPEPRQYTRTGSGKHEKFKAQYAALQHVRGKPFVVAVAPFEQPFFYVQLNRAIFRVLFAYDRTEPSAEVDQNRAKYIGSIQKPNGSNIRLGYFLNGEMEEISAVLF